MICQNFTGDTKMLCMAQAVHATRAMPMHHIQRLMVLGNFALLAGIAPSQVNAWFLIVMPMRMSGWNCPTYQAWCCLPMGPSGQQTLCGGGLYQSDVELLPRMSL